MNFLNKLLNNQKVEWKTLGEVATQINGMSGVSNKWAPSGNCKFIDYLNAYNNLKIDVTNTPFATVKNLKQKELKKGDILFTSASETPDECAISAVIEAEIDEGIFLDDHLFGIRINDEYKNVINTTFLNYYFYSPDFRNIINKAVRGVTRFYISKVAFMKLPIPLPPLQVQHEIVRILDKFTSLEKALEKALEKELTLRQKQYRYYRDKLLNFDDNYNVKWTTLGEVCEIVTDFTAAGSFASNAKNVTYLQNPAYALLVRTTDIKQNFKNKKGFVYIDEHAFNYLWRVNLDKNSIILPNIGINCGEVYYITPEDLPYKNCALGPNALLVRSDTALLKFLYYWFISNNFQKELNKITSKAGQDKFNKTNLKTIKIPLPPLSEQERIVGILDKFDKLVNSISEGLPREIELRRKQYEYYRNELLNFEQ